MSDKKIYYRSGYKYQLCRDYHTTTAIRIDAGVESMFIKLDPDGSLTIKAGYAWDGPSGPTIDDRTNMRASISHDAKYQLMREKMIDRLWRNVADHELYQELIDDGMNHIRATLWYLAVNEFAVDETDPEHAKKMQEAP